MREARYDWRGEIMALALAIVLTDALTSAALADEDDAEPEEFGVVSFTLENDLVADSDRDYTSGFRLDYITPKNDLTPFGLTARDNLRWLTRAENWYERIGVGQNIYTPSDIKVPNPPPDERPYAGFLYFSYGLSADRGDRLDTIAFDIGVVGPPSLAEPTQKIMHDIIDVAKPLGWDTQLETEPAFRLMFERKYKFGYNVPLPLLDLQFDAAPHVNVTLGTVDTSAGAGVMLRFGQDLADDYGPPRVRPGLGAPGFFENSDGFGWYLFGGVEGRVIGRNLFLEGNTFGQRDGVTIHRGVVDFQLGAAVRLGSVELSYTHILRSEEYAEQNGEAQFGSLNIRAKF